MAKKIKVKYIVKLRDGVTKFWTDKLIDNTETINFETQDKKGIISRHEVFKQVVQEITDISNYVDVDGNFIDTTE